MKQTFNFARIAAVTFLLGFVLPVVFIPRLSADENLSQTGDIIDMVTGDIQSVPVNGLTRVSVTDPEVADISDAEATKVSLIAKKEGETVLFLWDADGKRRVKVRVANEDLDALKARVQKLLQEANIEGVSLEENLDIGKVVLTGDLSKDDKNRTTDVLQRYSDNLLNLIKEEKSEDLIQVDMQIVEINTSLEKNLGILWGNSSSTSGSSSTSSGGTASSATASSGGNSGQIGLNYGENLPTGHSFADLFKIGSFQRSSPLEVTVNALVQEGKAKLISKPRLVVVSGKQASFLVGGEIPVESTTVSTTGSTLTSNTTYAQYGVNLSVTPTIREGKVDVLLNVDIRDIDASNSSNGNTAFITRTASTDLFVDNKQTVVLAGLIKYTNSEQITKVPFLGDIPVLGLLFRNHANPTPEANTEMVIILTPTVLTEKKFTDREIVMPTSSENSAYREFDAKYDHAPVASSWPATSQSSTTTTVAADTTTPENFPAMTAYARMVQERISRAIAYPSSGGNAGAGTVKLKLLILKNGSLYSEEVMESSGNDVLDQDAIEAAKAAAPYDAFSSGMDQDELTFTIPIVYNKLISRGQVPANRVIASY